MNPDYAFHAFAVLLLSTLAGLLIWSLGYAVYLNRIHSHGRASTLRLLRTLRLVAPLALLLSACGWEACLLPVWALARLGHSASQLNLGQRYHQGDHLLAKHPGRARWWFTRAAKAGQARAQLALAGLELQGWGAPKADLEAALSWARLAAAQQLPEAMVLTGELLLRRPGLAQPGESAQDYFSAARPRLQAQAAAGDTSALFTLGLLQLRGLGQPADPEAGLRLLRQAESQGLSLSQKLQLDLIRSERK